MKFSVPVFHALNSGILSSSLLFDCVFLFPDHDSASCDSAHTFGVSVLNSHLSFGLDTASAKSGEICPGFRHK